MAIYARRFVVWIGNIGLVEFLLAGVDGGLVSLVVDHEHGSCFRVSARRKNFPDPSVEVAKDADIFLHNEQDWPLLDTDPHMIRDSTIEVAVGCLRCQVFSVQSRSVNDADADARKASARCGRTS